MATIRFKRDHLRNHDPLDGGDDHLEGGQGADILDGAAGNDNCIGGIGNILLRCER